MVTKSSVVLTYYLMESESNHSSMISVPLSKSPVSIPKLSVPIFYDLVLILELSIPVHFPFKSKLNRFNSLRFDFCLNHLELKFNYLILNSYFFNR